MPGESLSFEITASDRASSSFRSVGRAAADASVKMDLAAASAKLWDDTTAKQGKAAATSEAAMRSHAKAAMLLADTENVLGGRATKTTKLMADQGRAFDDVAKKAGHAAGGLDLVSNTAGLTTSGWGALIAAGVALSPVIATVGTGLLGFGAAAYGVAKPIATAAQATGGLSANLSKLNPEQRQVAAGLLGLGDQFAAFQKQMQPAVFTVFNRGIQLAGHLLHDVQPVASATGKALGGMLGQIDAEFQSGTWQDFFGFMARTAGPDVQLLSQDFTGLLNILPPLLEGLQGVATEILKDAGGIFRLIGGIEALVAEEQHLKQAATDNTGVLGALGHAVGQAFGQMFPGAQAAKKVADNLGLLGENAAPAAKNVKAIVTPVWSLNTAVAALNTSMDTLVGNLLTLQGGNLSWKQAMQSATSQLKSNSAGLAGNSKNALANKQAVLQVTQQALAFAHQELTTGHNIGGASQTIQAQIKWLQGLHDKSAFVRNEIEALRKEEARLQAEHVNQTINVQGLGHWSVSQSLAPGAGHRRAAGGLIPGTGSGDTYPALLTPGEVVVPRPMVSAGAVDHLRGRLPGFAAGGIVPSYSGAVAGMPPWVRGNDQATIRLIDLAVVKATAAGIKSAQTAALAAMTSSRVGGHFGGGVQQWAGLVSRALAMEGLSPMLLGRVLFQMQTESGGNPNAINLTDSNAAAGDPSRGLMQTIGSTFRAYHWPGTSSNIYDPLANIAAALNYARHRYGPSLMSGGMGIGSGHGYDAGGWLPPGLSLAYNGTGRPEAVIPGRGGGGQQIVLEVAPGGEGALTAALLNVLRKQIRIRGGDVQGALGRL